MSIYRLILGQILRHFFTIAAGVLATVGVTTEMRSELVETTVTIVVPIILLIISQGWSFLQKQYFPQLLETALLSNPASASIDDVKAEAKENAKAPVIY